MGGNSVPSGRRPRRLLIGVILVVVCAAINALTGPYLAIAIPSGEEQERLLGVLLTAFSSLAILIAWLHYRRPDVGTILGLVLVTLGFGAMTMVLALGGGDLTTYYAVQTAVVAVGAGLAFRPTSG